jgi:hypothetical protein
MSLRVLRKNARDATTNFEAGVEPSGSEKDAAKYRNVTTMSSPRSEIQKIFLAFLCLSYNMLPRA